MSDPVDIQIHPAPPLGSVATLGRLRATDSRDRRYGMAPPPTTRTFRNWLSPGPVWDQGQTPMCVSYGTNRFLTSLPIVNKPPMALDAFYHECQLVDEWAGTPHDGTSVRAAFKVLKTLGLVSAYTWGTTVDEVTRQILEVGPVVVGFDWTDEMFTPDDHGYIWPRGQVVGGHAFLLTAVNMRRINPDGSVGAVRMLNSWSVGWGQGGHAWLSLDTLGKLLHGLEDWPGEAATALELRVR